MKKIKLLLLLIVVVFSNTLQAQDLVLLKTGDEIEAKVLELSDTDVKYKKTSNTDGPVYTVSKSKVFMIKYENGEKEVFNTVITSTNTNKIDIIESSDKLRLKIKLFSTKQWVGNTPISKSKLLSLLADKPNSLNEFKSGSALHTVGMVMTIPSSFVFGMQLGALIAGEKVDPATMFIISIFSVGGYVMGRIGENQMEKAIGMYNNDKKVSFMPIISYDKIGFVMRF